MGEVGKMCKSKTIGADIASDPAFVVDRCRAKQMKQGIPSAQILKPQEGEISVLTRDCVNPLGWIYRSPSIAGAFESNHVALDEAKDELRLRCPPRPPCQSGVRKLLEVRDQGFLSSAIEGRVFLVHN